MTYQLTNETINTIRGDMLLLDKISKALKVKPETVLRLTFKGYQRLTDISILKIIAEHTGKHTDELIEESTEIDGKVKSVA